MTNKFDFLYSSPLFKSPKFKNFMKIFKGLPDIKRGCGRNLNRNFKIILTFKEQFQIGFLKSELRGGRKLNKTNKNLNPVPNIKNAYFIYTFLIDIPVIWNRITNGEKALIQPHTARNLNYHHLNFKSSNPVYPNQTRLIFDYHQNK